MKKVYLAALAAALLAIAPAPAIAQGGCASVVYGAVLTAGQWNSCFAAKQNTLGYTPLNEAGDTMAGKLVTAAPTVAAAGINLPPGSAPSAPVNGDMWMTSAGLFLRANGVTLGPYNNPIFTGSSAPGAPQLYQLWMDTAASTIPFKQWDGSQWVTLGTLNPSTHVWTPASGGAPGGAAGGDLTGTYPNPTVGTNKVTNAKAAQMAANTIKANVTSGTANASDVTMSTCNGISSALNYTANSGFGCNAAINPAYAAATSVTATATCGTAGTIDSQTTTFRYWVNGKKVSFSLTSEPVYAVCTAYIKVPLPFGTATTNVAISGAEFVNGFSVYGAISAGGTDLNIFKYDGTMPTPTGGKLVLTGEYEIN